jgi:hypothetical protein
MAILRCPRACMLRVPSLLPPRRLLATSARPAPLPKARAETDADRRRAALEQWGAVAAVIAGLAAGALLLSASTGRSVPETVRDAAEALAAAGQPDSETVASGLPPLGDYSNPATGAPGRARGPVILRTPSATLVLGWEGTAVRVAYLPTVGYVATPRPGLVEVLLACADADVEVAFWSTASSAGTVQEQLRRLVSQLVAQVDADRYTEFRAFVTDAAERSRAYEAAEAAHERRPMRPLPPVGEADMPELYASCVLRISGVLGRELSHRSADGRRLGRDVATLVSQREAEDVLVVVAADEVGDTLTPAPPLAVARFEGEEGDVALLDLARVISRFGQARRGAAASEAGTAAAPLPRLRAFVAQAHHEVLAGGEGALPSRA